jgi:hypothetical protein
MQTVAGIVVSIASDAVARRSPPPVLRQQGADVEQYGGFVGNAGWLRGIAGDIAAPLSVGLSIWQRRPVG